MKITKCTFSKPYISWNERFDLSFTLKMGDNQTINKNYDGWVQPFIMPNNINASIDGCILVSDFNEEAGDGASHIRGITIAKDASKSIKATNGYIDPDGTVINGPYKGKTYLDAFKDSTHDNGASRAYNIKLYVDAGDGYGNGRLYKASYVTDAIFLLERHAPKNLRYSLTDATIGWNGSDAITYFGHPIQNKSRPIIKAVCTLDEADPSLKPSYRIRIFDPNGNAKYVHRQDENGRTIIYTVNENGAEVQTGEYTEEPGTLVLETLSVAGQYKLNLKVTDSAGLTAETEGYFFVLPYSSPRIDVFHVERYMKSWADNGDEIYLNSDDGTFVRFDITASAAAINGIDGVTVKQQNQCYAYIRFGQDDIEVGNREIVRGSNGLSINISKDQKEGRELLLDEFSAAHDWSFSLTIRDFFGDTVPVTDSIDRAGGEFNIETFGVAIGMRSTGQTRTDTKRPYIFEVASTHESYFYGGISGVTNYTTTEIATGGMWIDDKPIYRRTFVYDISAADTEVTIATIESLGSMVSMNGAYHQVNGQWTAVNHYWSDNYYVWAKLYDDGSIICFNKGRAGTIYLTIEYTKK